MNNKFHWTTITVSSENEHDMEYNGTFLFHAGYNHMMRKTSNLTDDSGRGSQSDHLNHTGQQHMNGGLTDDGLNLPNMVSSSSQQEHLSVPRPGSNVSTSGIDTNIRTSSNVSPDTTPDSTTAPNKPPSPELQMERDLKTKHAPKIIYSHSEDRLTTTQEGSRPIIPGLPYSPYNSPHGSPRLRRYV